MGGALSGPSGRCGWGWSLLGGAGGLVSPWWGLVVSGGGVRPFVGRVWLLLGISGWPNGSGWRPVPMVVDSLIGPFLFDHVDIYQWSPYQLGETFLYGRIAMASAYRKLL
jgi:hypothetical protein